VCGSLGERTHEINETRVRGHSLKRVPCCSLPPLVSASGPLLSEIDWEWFLCVRSSTSELIIVIRSSRSFHVGVLRTISRPSFAENVRMTFPGFMVGRSRPNSLPFMRLCRISMCLWYGASHRIFVGACRVLCHSY
jgi:hypothetical protein